MNTNKKKYKQSFREAYSAEFPFVKKSSLGLNYASCTICNADFLICYGGKNDIKKHLDSFKHQEKVKNAEKHSNISSYFANSHRDNGHAAVMNAELLFTNFLIEHNLPISAADHAGPLFRKMFPDSAIAKKFSCARTKTSALINVLASENKKDIVSQLQKVPFAMGIDGSNDSDSKIHPIVVNYFDTDSQKMETCLLSLNPIKERSTGKNIAATVIDVFENLDIPIKNCVAFVADNAPVMMGEKSGVIFYLKEKHDEMIKIGCSCHLLNLAAQKAASALPADIEQTVIDIFYYLEKSANRKENLKSFQNLHNTDIRKILKHVPTRWLSLNKCLQRIIEQWQPLLSFFLNEVKKCPVESTRKRKSEVENHMSKKIKISSENAEGSTKKKEVSERNGEEKKKSTESFSMENNEEKKSISKSKNKVETMSKKIKMNSESSSTKKKSSKQKLQDQSKSLSKEDRIFYFLSSEINKAYAYFLLYIIPEFENKNILLQSSAPQIHKLHDIYQELLKNLFLKFVKPSVIKNTELLQVDFQNRENQKDDSDISIGNLAYNIVMQLKNNEQKEFYGRIRQYYLQACCYIIQKFPLSCDIIQNADVANLTKIEHQSFNKLRFFIDKFPFLLQFCKKELETEDKAWDRLQEQFDALQIEDLSDVLLIQEADLQIQALQKIKNYEGSPKYDALCCILSTILTIPHSNANCERLFSVAKKNRTTFRSELSDKSLENLLLIKTKNTNDSSSSCFNVTFSDDLLSKAKRATFNMLNCQ